MRKNPALPVIAIAMFALIAGFATSAYATPSKTGLCSGCHSGPNVAVSATESSNNGTVATYDVSAPGATVISVFDGGMKVAQITGASGTVSVGVGGAYTVFAVKGPSMDTGIGSTIVTPVAPGPVPDPTPVPTPTPDPTPVPTPTPDPTPVPTPTPEPTTTVKAKVTVHVVLTGHRHERAMVTLHNTVTGKNYRAMTDKRGNAVLKKVPFGTYDVRVSASNRAVFKTTLVVDEATESLDVTLQAPPRHHHHGHR